MKQLNDFFDLAGRILIAAIFVFSGFGKISGYAGTQAYMEAMGVPGGLLPLVILLELGGGLAIIAGLQTRLFAFLLGGFSLLSGLLFHADFGEQTQLIMFMKNLGLAGGFLFLVAHGPGRWSIDARLRSGAVQ